MGRIALHGVTRCYRSGSERVDVLSGVDLSVPSGSFCSISGPSGSGKSTLLNLMGLIDRPDEGRISIDGTEVQDMSERELVPFRAHHIGFVFQSFHLIPVLTAVENVAWPLYFQGVRARVRLARAREMLIRVGLGDEADRLPKHLSGGQQQRVAIARALVSEPKLVLADEPTANLDRRTGEAIMDLMADLNSTDGTTLIAATHDPLVIAQASLRISVAQGQIFPTSDHALTTGGVED